jgi:Type II secretion system (T2SS), protein M subtype b
MKITRSGSFSLLNLHFATVAVLAIVNVVLLVQLVLAWHTLHAARPEQIAQLNQQKRVAELQALPLRDLPAKLKDSSAGAAEFYDLRVASADSAIVAELGELAQKAEVRITRLQYGYAPAIQDITEVRMDASVSGDYTPVMRFINSMERDKMFFVINGLTLTGQQGGLVNLRLRVTTYLRGADLDRLQPSNQDSAQDSDRNPGGA